MGKLLVGKSIIQDVKYENNQVLRVNLDSEVYWEKYTKPIIYGFHVNPNISDPSKAITYLYDAINKTPVSMIENEFNYGDWKDAFFMPRPCMLRYDGTVAYYLDPNDYSKKADGTSSDIANPAFAGNAMMEWGQIWYKFEAGKENGEGYFYCSDKKVDDTYHCWCNYDAKDNIIPHFYTAIYNGTIVDSRMRSISGLNLGANGGVDKSGGEERAAALANNVNADPNVYPEWYTCVWSDYSLISALLILMGRSLDVKAVFGYGLRKNNGEYNASGTYTTGACDKFGQFDGDPSTLNNPVKVFGMENWWGVLWRRTVGLSTSDYWVYKLTYGTADGTTYRGYEPNSSGAYVGGYMAIRKNENFINADMGVGFISKMHFGPHGFVPLSLDGADGTYWSSYGAGSYSSTVAVGGDNNSVDDTVRGGLAVACNNSFNSNYPHIGSALSCKPLK